METDISTADILIAVTISDELNLLCCLIAQKTDSCQAEALEFAVHDNSPITGVPLSELKLKKNLLICCLTRNGAVGIPLGHELPYHFLYYWMILFEQYLWFFHA